MFKVGDLLQYITSAADLLLSSNAAEERLSCSISSVS